MNFKTTLILAVLVCAGAGIMWYLSGTTPAESPADDAPSAQTRYVLESRPERDEVVRVALERSNKPSVTFERSGEKDGAGRMEDWRMTAPIESEVEGYTVDGLVSLVTGLQYAASFKPGAKGEPTLADAGLSPPAATITLTDKAGKTSAIEVGGKPPLSTNMYVRVVGEEDVKIVQRDLTMDIRRDVKDFRAKGLLRMRGRTPVALEVDYAGKHYELTKNASDEWTLTAPVAAPLLKDKVTAATSSLGTLRAAELLDEVPDPAVSGLDDPYLRLAVQVEEKKLVTEPPATAPATQPAEPRFETVRSTHTLRVGGFADLESKNRYVRIDEQPWVATVDAAAIERLVPKLKEWRDPKLVRMTDRDARRIELRTAEGAEVTLTREAGEWSGAGDLERVEPAAVQDLLTAFTDLRAIDFIDEPADAAEYGLDAPRATLMVAGAGADGGVTLHVGAATESGRNAYVRVEGSPTVAVVAETSAARLAVSPLSLRSREIFALDPASIQRIELARGAANYVLTRDGSQWKLEEPAGAPLDGGSSRDLVNNLASLRARQVVARGESAAYGLEEPAVTIRFTAAPPPTGEPPAPAEPVEHTLRVGRTPTGVYAQRDDDPYVFELDQTVERVLTAELIDRGVFGIKPEDVTSLRIDSTGGTLHFAKEDTVWKYVPDPFVTLSQKLVEDFVREIATMRVEAYIVYRDGDVAAEGLENAPVTVTMGLADGQTITLKIDQVRRGELPRKAAWLEQRRIFLMRQSESEKLFRGLDYYARPDEEPAAPAPAPEVP